MVLFMFLILQVDRRAQVDVIDHHRMCKGIRAWRKLVHYLIEMRCLFGPIGEQFPKPSRVCYEMFFQVKLNILHFTAFILILGTMPCL